MEQPTNPPPESASKPQTSNDPLLRLAGSGKHVWADEPADEYVNRLRDDWFD